jgi:hypothetical protein
MIATMTTISHDTAFPTLSECVALAALNASAHGQALVADIVATAANDPRVFVSRRESEAMQGIGPTRQVELELAGELRSIVDGSRRRISAASIYARLARLAILAHPKSGPPVIVRQPRRRYAPRAASP